MEDVDANAGRGTPPSEREVEALRVAVAAAAGAIDAVLDAAQALLDPADAQALRVAAAHARARSRQPRAHIVVVGESRAGKTTLINAMLGASVLPAGGAQGASAPIAVAWGPVPALELVLADGRVDRFADHFPDPVPALRARERDHTAALAARRSEAQAASSAEEAARAQRDARQADLRAALVVEADARARAERLRAITATHADLARTAGANADAKHLVLPTLVRDPAVRWWWAPVSRLLCWWHRQALAAALDARRGAQDAVHQAESAEQASAAAVADHLRAEARRAGAEGALADARAVHIAAAAARDAAAAALAAEAAARTALVARIDAAERAWHDAFVAQVAAACRAGAALDPAHPIALRYPGRLLPRGVVLIDTPGLNATDPGIAARAWATVRAEADAVLVVSDIRQALPASLLALVSRLGVPCVALALSRADLVDADSDEPEVERAEALRAAVGRFSAAFGQRPADVQAVTVASAQVLRAGPGDRPAIARFDADVGALLAALESAAPLAVAARSAQDLRLALRRCGEASAAAVRAARGVRAAPPSAAVGTDTAWVSRAADHAAALSIAAAGVRADAERAMEAAVCGELEPIRAALAAAEEASALATARTRAQREVPLVLQRALRQARAVGLHAAERAVVRAWLQVHGRETDFANGQGNTAQEAGLQAEHEAESREVLHRLGAFGGPWWRAEPEPTLDAQVEAGVRAALDAPAAHEQQRALTGAAAGLAVGAALSGGLVLPAVLAVGAATAAVRWLGGRDRAQNDAMDALDRAHTAAWPGLVRALDAGLPDGDALLMALHSALQAEQAETEAAALTAAQAAAALEAQVQELRAHAQQLGDHAGEIERGLRAAAGQPGVLFLPLPTMGARVELAGDGGLGSAPAQRTTATGADPATAALFSVDPAQGHG